ncbi:ATP-binding cassette sub-family A member 1 [Trichonephila clavipes]|nr:ATP-binding cassette sub-family A member 1 [Trichonephila clavipes]
MDWGGSLEELHKIVNIAGVQGLSHILPFTSTEFFRLLPAMVFVANDLNTMEEFAKKGTSRNFCVNVDALEATQLHWKWLLCTDSTTAHKIPLPNKNILKKDNLMASSGVKFKHFANFDAQVFSQILLQLSSGLSFTLKAGFQFLKPVKGCESTCGDDDVMLKKMCFLGRLQNVKSLMNGTKNENDEEQEDNLMQEGMTDRCCRSHSPQCTTSREDRQIVRMTVTDLSVTSRTVAQHFESVTHHSVSARTIRRHLQQRGLSARSPLFCVPLTQNHRRLRRQWCDERRIGVAEWNEIVFTDESRICLKHHDGRI